jgi:arsenite-transporting ATPase
LRLLLLTGTGGAGTTTVAAATALHAARRGTKTLLLAPRPPLDAAAGPAGPLGVGAAGLAGLEPVEVEPGLSLLQPDARAVTARAWSGLAGPLGGLLRALGADPLDPEEFAAPHAVADVVALLAIRDAALAGWDLVVVDTGPFDTALALLAMPAAGARLVERVLPVERRMLWAMGHGAAPGDRSTAFRPGRGVVEAAERLHGELAAVRDVLEAPSTVARLVVTGDPRGAAQAVRARTALALIGLAVDAVVVNRLVPAGEAGWAGERAAAQQQVLADAATAVAPLPVARLTERARGVRSATELADLADELAGDLAGERAGEPAQQLSGDLTGERGGDLIDIRRAEGGRDAGGGGQRVERDGDGFVLVLALPGARRADLELARRGDELVVDVAGLRRLVTLPSVLRRCDVTGAALRAGELRVAFRPDPALWRSL